VVWLCARHVAGLALADPGPVRDALGRGAVQAAGGDLDQCRLEHQLAGRWLAVLRARAGA
jgi:hypothetical protein